MVSGERSLSNVGQNVGKKAGGGGLPNFNKTGGAVAAGNKKSNQYVSPYS
jgi:hypothetical protein